MFPLIGVGYFAIATVPLVFYDLRERRLPNKLTLPGLALALVAIALSFDWSKFLVALGVGVLLFLAGTLLSMRGWIGMGDVKLVCGLAPLLSWFDPNLMWVAGMWSFGVAGAVVLVGYLMKKITARSTIALGPYLLLGFWLAITPTIISKLNGAF